MLFGSCCYIYQMAAPCNGLRDIICCAWPDSFIRSHFGFSGRANLKLPFLTLYRDMVCRLKVVISLLWVGGGPSLHWPHVAAGTCSIGSNKTGSK